MEIELYLEGSKEGFIEEENGEKKAISTVTFTSVIPYEEYKELIGKSKNWQPIKVKVK